MNGAAIRCLMTAAGATALVRCPSHPHLRSWVTRIVLAVVLVASCLPHTAAERSWQYEEEYFRRRLWQQAGEQSNETKMEQGFIIRITGPNMVPFTIEHHQKLLLEAFQEALLPTQHVFLLSYKEGYLDPGSPSSTNKSFPFVDVAGTVYDAQAANKLWQPDLNLLLSTSTRFLSLGNWPRSYNTLQLVGFYSASQRLEQLGKLGNLQPILPLEAFLSASVEDTRGGKLTMEQAYALTTAARSVLGDVSTTLYVSSRNSSTIQAMLDAAAARQHSGRQLIRLEVTMVACQSASSMRRTFNCELSLLQERLDQMVQSSSVQQSLLALGVDNLSTVEVRVRPTPSPPPPLDEQQTAETVPWHLDVLDQREDQPLDGRFTANATGTGVHLYVLSSGIRADHQEFGYLDGRQGSRVVPDWGYAGLEPDSDCPDYFAWHGYGTYVASLAGGLTLGVAKNATIHSVRYRRNCVVDEPGDFMEGVPAAIHYVLANHTKPAIMVLDAWWRKDRTTIDDDDLMERTYNDLMDQCKKANITVILYASARACENPLARHPHTIAIGSNNYFDDNPWTWGPPFSPCIDMYGPGGMMGQGVTGASPGSRSEYTTVVYSASAWVAGGIAAQVLERNPTAGPDEVKQALLAMATHTLPTALGATNSSEASVLFTNLTTNLQTVVMKPDTGLEGSMIAGNESNSEGAETGETSSSRVPMGVIVPVAVGGAALLALALFVIIRRRGQRVSVRQHCSLWKPQVLHKLAGTEWEIQEDQLEICTKSDGSPWLLGQGKYGQVFRAVKGGVQVVAAKKLHGHFLEGPRRELFEQEIALMKYVSRDANVCQFYGACIRSEMMLVVEYMEGGDLRMALDADRGGELGWFRRGKAVALDILRGLHFLHESHVTHRDIKSRNILLTRKGRAKISDVGLAQLMEGEEEGSSDGARGTSAYSAPELLHGKGFTKNCDVFSFGILLWELVTHEVPQRGRLRDPLVPQECPQEVAEAIQDCLQVLVGVGGWLQQSIYVLRQQAQLYATAQQKGKRYQEDPAQRPTARELYSRLLQCPPMGDYQDAPCSPAAAFAAAAAAAVGAASPFLTASTSVASPRAPAGAGFLGRGYPWALELESGCPAELGAANGDLRCSRESMTMSGSDRKQSGSSAIDPEQSYRFSSASDCTHQPYQTSGSCSSDNAQAIPADLALLQVNFAKICFCKDADGSLVTLGEGAFGKVVKVLLDGSTPLAAKSIALSPDPAIHESFIREASLLGKLRHRNIVSLAAVSLSAGKGYMLMELMEGGSLHDRLNLMSRSTGRRVFGWYQRGRLVALDVARGIAYLHSQRVTHFDIKSGNILLTSELTAKISDVGLARVMECTHHSLSHNRSVGTFAYLAPELLAGCKCTQAVDLYSYGVLLWELCTGEHPVRGMCDGLQVPEDCPQSIADLHRRCVSADPAVRPSAAEVVELVRAAAREPMALGGSSTLAPAAAQDGPAVKQVDIRLPQPFASPFAAMREK